MTPDQQISTNALFQELVKNHGDRIFNLALMKCNQSTLAEDICQETYLRAYKGLSKFREESQLGTWIYRIALNVCHSMIKKESQRSRLITHLDDNMELELVDEGSSIQDLFIQNSKKDLIRKAISALPPLQSDAITLYYLKEFQYTEVAEIMNIPINTVKSHLRRAKENLRRLIPEVER